MSLPPTMLRSQIAEAKKRLAHLMREQQQISQEIADLRDLIRANANLLPDEERSLELLILGFFKHPANITEAVKVALFITSAFEKKISPTEIKGFAEHLGFDFSEYSNPMASIHTILRRMREADPPTVDYDEKTDAYWFGETTLVTAKDVISPQTFADTYEDVALELLGSFGADADKIPGLIQSAAKSSLGKRAAALVERKGRS